MGAFTVERSYSVMTGGSLVARSTGTVINVLAAVISSPAIDAHTLIATVGVVACAPILAGIGHQLALINILCAKLTCEAHISFIFHILNFQMGVCSFSKKDDAHKASHCTNL